MKINDLYETQQDEGIGSALAKGVGAVSKGVASVAGGAHGAWDAAKQGYQAGRAAVSGQAPAGSASTATNAASTTPAPTTGATATAPGSAPTSAGSASATAPAGGATAKGTADFGTIQRSIKTLSPNQKTALASQLAGKTPATTAPAAPATTPPATTAPTGPQKGQEVALASGEKYRFAGQQWVEVDPNTGAEVGGAALPAGFQKSLTGIAAKQQAASTTDAGTPNLRVVDGGKAAVAEGFYYRSKFLNIIL
jgi:flagellar hook-length control protein FliK